MKDNYLTLSEESEGIYREKGSKFIAYAIPVSTKEEIDIHIDRINKLHPKSRHLCYAYRLGIEGKLYRINDDGEPSGSAGQPIYNQLLSHNITNVFVGVIRYFGGTKLGVPGLINAYKTSTKEAIVTNTIIEKYLSSRYKITFEYRKMGDLMNHLKKLGIFIVTKQLIEHPSIIIEMRKSLSDKKIRVLKSKLLQLPLEMITEETQLEGIKIVETDD